MCHSIHKGPVMRKAPLRIGIFMVDEAQKYLILS